MTTNLGFPVPYGLTVDDLLAAMPKRGRDSEQAMRYAAALGYLESAARGALSEARRGTDPTVTLIAGIAYSAVQSMTDDEYAALMAHAEQVAS